MECTQLCCKCCCSHPCFNGKRQKDRYSHIEYYQPSRTIDDVPVVGVPMKKMFDFPQETRQFRQHSYMRAYTSDSVTDSVIMPVTQQPTSRELDCEPMYVSNKGRTIGTISELPPDSQSESPPFTPPPLTPTHHSFKDTQYEPAVEFSLYYDIQKRVLSVRLVCAYNLTSETWGSTDFFLSVFILPSRDKIYQTNVSSKATNPVFNEEFEFHSLVSEELYEHVLVFQLFSHDKFSRDHLVGSVIVPLSEADLFGVSMVKKVGEGRELLQRFATGDLLLSLCYIPQSNMIHGIVLKASNLPRPHKWGLADPYVKVYLLHKQQRMSKWKSTMKKSTLAPVFNDTFEFNVLGMNPQDISIELFVMDHDMFRRNDVIGMVYIGPNVHTELGVTHYQEMLASPQHPISHWHKLIPHSHVKTRRRHKSNTM